MNAAIDGLGSAYSMSTDLSLILAAIAIAISGDPIAGTWSIGGAYNGALGLLGKPGGIVGTHSRYEGDASIVRVSQHVMVPCMNIGGIDDFNREMHTCTMEMLDTLRCTVGNTFTACSATMDSRMIRLLLRLITLRSTVSSTTRESKVRFASHEEFC